ncbi:ATP-binding protein [Kistimonas scapharcae]|uniref:ATP-binding protein n=1 Tax=Kistimonas scapharcae TaxID=1036133 RepID=A0ABP8V1S8_9GAMM
MNFYNRETELALLQDWSQAAATHHSGHMSLVVGRRRVGKTALLNRAFRDSPCLYLFISRKQESLLCEEFTDQIRATLDIPVFGKPSRLREIMEILLQYSQSNPLTVILDEFQDLYRVNKGFFSELQDLWDRYKPKSHMHLICCGSLYSLMTRIFQDQREPLFGRADHRINLQPLKPRYIAELLKDTDRFCPERLLSWYMLSGGVPKYLEWLSDADKGTDIWPSLVNEHSLILEEGHYRLAEEFGPEHGIYFSIMGAIASGKTSRPEIESVLETSVGPHLERLENDFDILSRHTPVLANPGTRLLRYRIRDAFLAFWFRFIYRYRSAIEIGNYAFICQIIERDYPTWSGLWLEQIIREYMADSGKFSLIGSYWERGNQNEIDIVALNELDKTAIIAEVKRNPANIRLSRLEEKSLRLRQKLKGYSVELKGYSMSDLEVITDAEEKW